MDTKQRGSLTERVTDWILRAILDGEIELGEALSADRLATTLGVSRSPVRQALTILEQQGLIDVRPQRGSFVFKLDQEDLRKLCEFRRMVELDALRLAMLRNRARTLAAMKAAAERMQAAHEDGDRRRLASADDDFHDALLVNSDNPYLIKAYRLFSGKVAALRRHRPIAPSLGTANAEHFAIIAMLEDGDLQGALDSLGLHVLRMADRIEEGLAPRPAPNPTGVDLPADGAAADRLFAPASPTDGDGIGKPAEAASGARSGSRKEADGRAAGTRLKALSV